MRLPNWHRGAPWYVLPFVWFGYAAMLLAFLILVLIDWWVWHLVVFGVLVIVFVVIGEPWWAVFAALGAVAWGLAYRSAIRKGED